MSALPEQIAQGFIEHYMDPTNGTDRSAAIAALANILRGAYGCGLVAGEDDLRKRISQEIQNNGPIDAPKLHVLTSRMYR